MKTVHTHGLKNLFYIELCLAICYIISRHNLGGDALSPRTGRPIMGEEPKNKQIALRVTETTARKFQECSDITGKSKTNLLEEMIMNSMKV